jgi:glycogen debranching enzyme
MPSSEWLVANGIGGFACGNVDGSMTRREHGLLIAGPAPPVRRTRLLSRVVERVEYRGASFDLQCDSERFSLDGSIPVWQFVLGDALVERRIAIRPGANITVVNYRVLRARSPLRFIVKMLVVHCGVAEAMHAAGRELRVDRAGDAVRVRATSAGGVPLFLETDRGIIRPEHAWSRDDGEDRLQAATVSVDVVAGEEFTLRASAGAPPDEDALETLARVAERDGELLGAWERSAGERARAAPPEIRALVLAADRFIVAHPLPGFPEGRSIVADYPGGEERSRDAMIALAGLTLVTGRYAVARTILRTFDRFVERGMLPRVVSERETPEPGSAEAALRFVLGVRAYLDASGDGAALAEFWPTLLAIVDRPESEPSALWSDALRALAALAPRAGDDAAPGNAIADACRVAEALHAWHSLSPDDPRAVRESV